MHNIEKYSNIEMSTIATVCIKTVQSYSGAKEHIYDKINQLHPKRRDNRVEFSWAVEQGL